MNPSTRSTQWLFGEADQALDWQIRHLLSTWRRLSVSAEVDVWTAAAVGAPLVRALLVDLAWQCGVRDLPVGVTRRALWEQALPALTGRLGRQLAHEEQQPVDTVLEVFELVEAYAFGHVDGSQEPHPTWFLDSQALWVLIDSSARVLVELSIGVKVHAHS